MKSLEQQSTSAGDALLLRSTSGKYAEILSRLMLWGEAITFGRAEATSTLSPDIYQNALELLFDCGKDAQKLSRILFDRKGAEQHSHRSALTTLGVWLEKADYYVTEARPPAEGDLRSPENERAYEADDQAESPDSQSFQDTYQMLMDSFDDNVKLLMDLLPSIEHILSFTDSRPADDRLQYTATFEASAPARIWISQIVDKYRDASENLVERLGEANWQRFCKLRMRYDNTLATELSQAKSVFHASNARSILHAPSTFQDSAIGTSLGTTTEYAHSTASHASFASSAADDSHHYNRVPPQPEEIVLGKPFRCPICDYVLSGIRHRIDWK